MKTKYYVETNADEVFTKSFESLDEAKHFANVVSMLEKYIDGDIKIVKVDSTTITTFRNGGELGL